MALTDYIDVSPIAPGWVRRRPHWQRMWRLGAWLIDSMLEGITQGRRAGMANAIDVPGEPGYGGFEDVGSLGKLARDEGVLHGLTESPPDLAFRIRNAQAADAGGYPAPPIVGLFEQLAGVLGPTPPLMRIWYLDSSDVWTRDQDGTYRFNRVNGDGLRYHPDGTITFDSTSVVAIDWDSMTSPPAPGQGTVGRWILILYFPLDTPYGTSGPYTFNSGAVFGHVWDQLQGYDLTDPKPWAATFGTNSPHALVERVFSVIASRHCVGFEPDHVVVCTDASQFKPDGSSVLPAGALGSAYPDGTWGWDTKYDPSTHSRIISRNSTAIYWRFPR